MRDHGADQHALHPGAWWGWALALAAAAAATTNVLVLALLACVVSIVVLQRRGDAPWALGFHQYLVVAGIILAIRVVMRLVFRHGDALAVALHAGLADGMRLAVMIICIGAANSLASPKQLLASLPAALYEVGTAVVIALSFFPQLVESVQRVTRARRLRTTEPPARSDVRRPRLRIQARVRAAGEVLLPVLEDAFDRSILLAASMDARGYGRAGRATPAERRRTGALLLLGLLGLCVGMYATLDATTPRALGTPMLIVGVALAAAGLRVAGRRVQRTRYLRPRWRADELWVLTLGVSAAALTYVAAAQDPEALRPVGLGLELPPLTLLPIVAVLLVLGAAAQLPRRRPVWRHRTAS